MSEISSTKLIARENIKVVKDYHLVDAGYHLSTRANILIGFLIGEIDSMHQDEILPYELSYSEIVEIVNFNGVRRISKRGDVPKIMEELNSKPIYFQEFEQGEIVTDNWITWISSLKYDRKKDTFLFQITKELHHFLLKLGTDPDTGETRPFIKYAWLLSTTFRCDYAIVFYELFVKRIRNDKSVSFELTIEKIKFKCLLQEKYERYYDLKRYVIEPSIKDINSSPLSLFSVSWSVGKKSGKAVKSIILNVTRRKSSPKLLPSKPVESFYLKVDELTGQWRSKLSKEYLDKLLTEEKTSKQIITAIETTNNKLESGMSLKSSEVAYFNGVLSNVISQGELFSDPVQEAKTARDEKQKKIRELHSKKKIIESEIEKIKKETHTALIKAIKDQSPEEINRVVQILIKERKLKPELFQNDHDKMLAAKSTRAYISRQFKKEGNKSFTGLDSMSDRIKHLEEELRKL